MSGTPQAGKDCTDDTVLGSVHELFAMSEQLGLIVVTGARRQTEPEVSSPVWHRGGRVHLGHTELRWGREHLGAWSRRLCHEADIQVRHGV